MRKRSLPAVNAIDIQIEEIAQLFHSLDPFPFREKDLDKEAEEFIVSWARELPVDQLMKILVHIPEAQAATPEARELGEALAWYFSYRALAIARDINELFRVGRRALNCRSRGALLLGFCRPIGRSNAQAAPCRPRHRRGLADFRMGGELEAN
jgi:hypothetical protein